MVSKALTTKIQKSQENSKKIQLAQEVREQKKLEDKERLSKIVEKDQTERGRQSDKTEKLIRKHYGILKRHNTIKF